MKFGIFNMTHAPVGRPHREIYDGFVELACEAERLGFHSIWTTEHHFQSDPDYVPFGASDYSPKAEYDITPDPLTLLAYVAAKTSVIRLGTAVSVVPWDHPIRLTERAAMLDVLSGGRVELGVGRGSATREGPVFGVPEDPAAAQRRFYEAIEVIRKAWAGEPFTHDGEFFAVPSGLATTPVPIQREAPLWLGSASDDSAVWAAKSGLPYATIAWPLTIMEGYKRKREIWRAAVAEAGHEIDDQNNVVLLYTYCGESADEAAETTFEHMRQFQFINEQHYEMLRNEEFFATVRQAMGFETVEDWVDGNARYAAEHHLVGTADELIERIRYHQEELSLGYVLMNHGFGLLPQDKAIGSMRRIAEKVMPHFAN